MAWRKWLGLEMTPARFARKVGKAMQAAQPGPMPLLDLDNFRLRISEGNYFNLHNVYHAYQNAPRKERDKVIGEFVASMLEAPELPATFDAARPLLLPVLRRKSLVDQALSAALPERQQGEGGAMLAYRAFGPDAVLALAIDAERSMSIVMEATLKQWGVAFETALDAAMDNLRDRSIDKFCAIDGAPGLTRGDWGDAYDSSRILLPDLLFRGVASGNPLVMVPTRETLLLAPANDVAAQLAMLASAGQALRESPRWCSTAIYQVVDGRLDVYAPQHPRVCESLRTLERDVAKSDHADQKALLDKAHECDGKDIFVASFAVMEKDGRMLSCCTWTEGVSAGMLPKTDVVALVRPRGGEEFDFAIVDWETLWARHADLLREMPTFPTRYWIATFPTALLDELIATRQREPA